MEPEIRDKQLLARVARRDPAALRALYAIYNVRIYRFVLRLARNETMAEDVVAETFLKVWQKASLFEGNAAVSSWLFAIARNETINILRKRREEQLDETTAVAIVDDCDDQETLTIKSDKSIVMGLCIAKLSDAHREIIDLVYYQEKTIAEISAIVGIPQNTVKTRMFHARKLLSEHFRRAGIDRSWP